MPSKHALNVSLTEYLSGFVETQVASGRFGTASEVVRAALRLLEQDLKTLAGGGGAERGHTGENQQVPAISAGKGSRSLAKRRGLS
jgi:putative addiction module CopG family antidote